MKILEYARDLEWETVRRNFERIDNLFSLITKSSDGFGFTVSGIGVRFGTFAGTTSAAGEVVIPVTHGLGRTPAAILATTNSASGTQITVRAINAGSTTFDAYVVRSAAAAVGVGGYWIAVG